MRFLAPLILVASCATCGCGTLPPPALGTSPALAEKCGADIARNDIAWTAEISFAGGSVASAVTGVVANNQKNNALTWVFGTISAILGGLGIGDMFVVRKTASDYFADGCGPATGPVPHPNVQR